MKILLSGAGGRMGKEIASLAAADPSIEIIHGIDRGAGEADFPRSVSFAELPPSFSADVVIDFSLPELMSDVCQWCAHSGTPLVSGTTGLGDDDFQKLKELSSKTAVLWSSNMSLGIAWFHTLMPKLAALGEGFDFQLEETHHRMKKDRPSGTAVSLQESLEKVVGKAPEPLSLRGGGVFGVHKLHIMGDEETINIEHVALNRTVFARGALRAASWLKDQPQGQYQMSDLF